MGGRPIVATIMNGGAGKQRLGVSVHQETQDLQLRLADRHHLSAVVCLGVAGVCAALTATGMLLLVGCLFASVGTDELSASGISMLWLGFSLVLGAGVPALLASSRASMHNKREAHHRELAQLPLVDRCQD